MITCMMWTWMLLMRRQLVQVKCQWQCTRETKNQSAPMWNNSRTTNEAARHRLDTTSLASSGPTTWYFTAKRKRILHFAWSRDMVRCRPRWKTFIIHIHDWRVRMIWQTLRSFMNVIGVVWRRRWNYKQENSTFWCSRRRNLIQSIIIKPNKFK